eukprot:SAG11_NODE_3040_length_2740_cov_15.737978_2_plen_68_part_00
MFELVHNCIPACLGSLAAIRGDIRACLPPPPLRMACRVAPLRRHEQLAGLGTLLVSWLRLHEDKEQL